eukprot:Lithocolla_globosa_v1_NODE_61_length_7363_cov_12.683498.p1 type:complete len:1255 gc:universal NODE_61_length_7363_cov_12.683498:2001-5765(+)
MGRQIPSDQEEKVRMKAEVTEATMLVVQKLLVIVKAEGVKTLGLREAGKKKNRVSARDLRTTREKLGSLIRQLPQKRADKQLETRSVFLAQKLLGMSGPKGEGEAHWNDWRSNLAEKYRHLTKWIKEASCAEARDQAQKKKARLTQLFHKKRRSFMQNILDKNPSSIASVWYETEDGQKAFTDKPSEVTSKIHSEFKKKYTGGPHVPEWFLHRQEPKQIETGLHTLLAVEWSKMRNITSATEFEGGLERMENGKAPGPSGVAIELFKQGTDELKEILKLVVDLLIKWALNLEVLTDLNMWLIPKSGSSGITEACRMRPIALREVILKLASTIVNDRVTKILSDFKLCHPNQQGFVNGGSTAFPLHTMAAVLDHAKRTDSELHLLLLDIEAAYDKLSYEAVKFGYKRLHATDDFLELKAALGQNGRCRGVSPCGTTDWIRMENGLPQGDPASPIDWVVALDPLLCLLDESDGGYVIPTEHENTALKVVAYADDLTIFGRSINDLQKKLDIVSDWCLEWGLSLSVSKSQYICRWPGCPQARDWSFLSFKNRSAKGVKTVYLTAVGETESFKYLGVFFDLNLTWEKEKERCWHETVTICLLVRSEVSVVTQAVYVLNAVLVGRLSYITQVAEVDRGTLRRIDTRMRETISAVAGFSRNRSMNTGVFHAGTEGVYELGLGLTSIVDTVGEMVPSDFLIALCSDPSQLRSVCLSSLAELDTVARKHGVHSALLMPNEVLRESESSGGAMRVKREMADSRAYIIPKAGIKPDRIPLLQMVALRTYQRHSKWWRQLGIKYLQDVITERQEFSTLEQMFPQTLFVGRQPTWYTALRGALCLPDGNVLRPEVREVLRNPRKTYPLTPPQVRLNELVTSNQHGGPCRVLFRVLNLTYVAGRYLAHLRQFEEQPRPDLGEWVLRQTTRTSYAPASELESLEIYLSTFPKEMRANPNSCQMIDRYVTCKEYDLARRKLAEEKSSWGFVSEASKIAFLGYGLNLENRLFPNDRLGPKPKNGPVDPAAPVSVIFTDGSTAVKGGKVVSSYALLVAEGRGRNQLGLVYGQPTNNKAELYAATIENQAQTPINSAGETFTDSQYACDVWESKITLDRSLSHRRRLRLMNRSIIQMGRRLFLDRQQAGGTMMLRKVKAHVKQPQTFEELQNEKVDRMAKVANEVLIPRQDMSILDMPGWLEHEEAFLAVIEGVVVEGDLRRALRQRYRAAHVAHWRDCRTQGFFRRQESEWCKESAIMLGKNANGTRKQSS